MMLKKAAFVFLYLLLVTAVCTAQEAKKADKQAKPDFSGKWIVDLAKSEVAPGLSARKVMDEMKKKEGTEFNTIGLMNMTIEHSDPTFKITERDKTHSEIVLTEATYYSDERGETNSLIQGAEASKTKWDGKKLVTSVFVSPDYVESSKVSAKITWELSKDGKTLTKKRVLLDPTSGTNSFAPMSFSTSRTIYRRSED